MLEALDVHHRFGDRVVLDGVNLSVAPGVLTGLLGPNGAGKTTLIRAILGVIEVDKGTILNDGVPITWADRRHRARCSRRRRYRAHAAMQTRAPARAGSPRAGQVPTPGPMLDVRSKDPIVAAT